VVQRVSSRLMARLAAHDVGKLSGIRLPEETCLEGLKPQSHCK
jgi:hypothetical protein